MGATKLQKLRKCIRDSLLDQLMRTGASDGCFADLIDDYMGMWDAKNALLADIRERGVTIENVTNAGVNLKKNDSVDQLVKINAQMLKLLDSLDIKAGQDVGDLEDAL